MAPSYANVFMGSLEDNFYVLTYGFGILPILIFIWTHGEKIVFDFRNKLNSFHPTIKFVSSHSTQEIIFLIRPFILTMIRTLNPTSIKPTGCLPLLHRQSYHPLSCKMRLVYSQILRYLRIISDGQKFLLRVERRRVTLLSCGYRDTNILPAAVDRASTWTQSQLLEPKEKNNISNFTFRYIL